MDGLISSYKQNGKYIIVKKPAPVINNKMSVVKTYLFHKLDSTIAWL